MKENIKAKLDCKSAEEIIREYIYSNVECLVSRVDILKWDYSSIDDFIEKKINNAINTIHKHLRNSSSLEFLFNLGCLDDFEMAIPVDLLDLSKEGVEYMIKRKKLSIGSHITVHFEYNKGGYGRLYFNSNNRHLKDMMNGQIGNRESSGTGFYFNPEGVDRNEFIQWLLHEIKRVLNIYYNEYRDLKLSFKNNTQYSTTSLSYSSEYYEILIHSDYSTIRDSKPCTIISINSIGKRSGRNEAIVSIMKNLAFELVVFRFMHGESFCVFHGIGGDRRTLIDKLKRIL